MIEGPELPDDRAGIALAAERNTIFCRITPEQKKALVGALADRGRFTAMIGDGVNDVPALKQARLAVAMGSGSQITKGIADIVLMRDQFSMLPRAVAEGRRIARNIHRLGRLYATKTVYAGVLILFTAIFGGAFPFLPRQLTIAATLTIGIPSFVLALAPSEGPLYRGRLLRALAAFAVPAGVGIAVGSLLSFFMVDEIFAGSLAEGRTAATTTLIVLGLCFILLLERGPGREHITIQSYMLAMIAGLGALYALALAAGPVREFFDLELLSAGQWFLSLLSVAVGLVLAAIAWRLPYIQSLEAPAEAPPAEETAPETAPAATGEPPTTRGAARHPTEHQGLIAMPAEPSQAPPDPAASGPRRTKIVATIGPATRSVERMAELIRAGADVFRLNFSHGSREEHAANVAMAREASQLAGQEVGLLGDLPGPKLRIDEVEGGVVQLEAGSELTLTTGEEIGDAGQLPVSWEGLPAAVSEGDEVYLADGRVRLRVLGATSGEVRCSVEVGRGGRLAPGAEHAGHGDALAVRRPNRPRLGRLRGSSRASTCSRCPSSAAPRTWSPSSAASGRPEPTSR